MNNDNRSLLFKAHVDLHNSVIEVLDMASAKRLRVRIKIDEAEATQKKPTSSVRFELYDGPKLAKGEESHEGKLRQIMEEVVARVNETARQKVDINDLSIVLGEKVKKAKKKA